MILKKAFDEGKKIYFFKIMLQQLDIYMGEKTELWFFLNTVYNT